MGGTFFTFALLLLYLAFSWAFPGIPPPFPWPGTKVPLAHDRHPYARRRPERIVIAEDPISRPHRTAVTGERNEQFRPGERRLRGDQPRSAGHLHSLVHLHRVAGKPRAYRRDGGHFRPGTGAAVPQDPHLPAR